MKLKTVGKSKSTNLTDYYFESDAWKTMSADPLLTVCLWTHNNEDIIIQNLDSITTQEVSFQIEVLVFDDASTDNTWEMLCSYFEGLDIPCRGFRPSDPVFLTGTKPFGFFGRFSRGSYLAFAEGRNLWADVTKLERQVSYLSANPDCFLSGHAASAICAQSGIKLDSVPSSTGCKDFSVSERMLGQGLYPWSTIVCRADFSFDPEFSLLINGDSFFWIATGNLGFAHFHTDINCALLRRGTPTSLWSRLADEYRQKLKIPFWYVMAHLQYERGFITSAEECTARYLRSMASVLTIKDLLRLINAWIKYRLKKVFYEIRSTLHR